MSSHNWLWRVLAPWQQSPARPRPQRRPFVPSVAIIGRMDCLEPRRMLANVVTIEATSQGVSLIDVDSQQATAGDAFDITYTATQITVTAKTGTELQIGGVTKTTHTINTTKATPLFIALNAPGNTVTITGDGTAALGWVEVRFGNDTGNNSLTMNKVVTDSVTVVGRRSNTTLTTQSSTFNGPFRALLGEQPSSTLTIDQMTINGPTRAEAKSMTVNQTTFDGRVSVFQRSSDSKLTTTASTYNETVGIVQGEKGVVNVNASTNGANKFHGQQVLKGSRNQGTILNVAENGAVNDIPPTLIRAESKTIKAPTAPTVDSATAAVAPEALTGTWDSANAQTLKVTAGGKTYTLGTDAALTSPSTGKWSLKLAEVTLTAGENAVRVVNSNGQGHSAEGKGTLTLTSEPGEQATIQQFLTANQLTATKTASGLNYVIQTQGTGAVPTVGQSLTVNYTGFLLNADGTQGTKFDSNVDPQFNHVTPFRFTLGQGRVIAGWDEAFALLPVGTVAKLLIPSVLGYGAAGSSPNIPANSILIFDVTLVSAQ